MKAKPQNKDVKAEMTKKLSTMTFEETMAYVRTNVVAGFRMFPAAGQTFDALLEKFDSEYKAVKEERDILKAKLDAIKEVVPEKVEETKEGE